MDMPDPLTHEQLIALQDRLDIVEVVCKYAVSIDRRRWDDLASCFADDVALNTIRTGPGVSLSREQLVAVMRRTFETYTATQHISANHQVVIEGDAATVLSTLNATHFLAGEPGGELHQQVGYYEYRLVRDGGWLISGVEQILYWQHGNQAIFDRTLR